MPAFCSNIGLVPCSDLHRLGQKAQRGSLHKSSGDGSLPAECQNVTSLRKVSVLKSSNKNAALLQSMSELLSNCCPSGIFLVESLDLAIQTSGVCAVWRECRRLRGGSVKYFSVYVLWDELCSQPSQECAKCTHPSINLSRSVPPCEKTKHFIKSRACWSRSSILVLFQLISLQLYAIVLIGSNLHLLGTLHTRHDDHTGLQGD